MDFYFWLVCASLLFSANAHSLPSVTLIPTAYPVKPEFDNCGFNLNATCDDKMKLFADGKLLATSDDWKDTSVVFIPPNTEEIEIRCTDGWILGGILASSENGLITNNAWNCSSDNGSTWNNAHELGANGVTSEDISADAKWIWTDRPTWTHTAKKRHTTAICTIKLPTNSVCGTTPTTIPTTTTICTDCVPCLFNGTTPTPTTTPTPSPTPTPTPPEPTPVLGFNLNATCNNKMELFVDGNRLATSDNWRDTSQVHIPANTQTIEIHCTDSCWLIEGILASSDDGLLTDDSWNCSSDDGITWSSAYEIAPNDLSVPDISPSAKWISTDRNTWKDGGKVICKVMLDSSVATTTTSKAIHPVSPISTIPMPTGCPYADKYVECPEFKDECNSGKFVDCMNTDCAKTCKCPEQTTTPSGCPSTRPENNSPCYGPQNIRCEYGRHECCGEIFPDVIMTCTGSAWTTQYVDSLCIINGNDYSCSSTISTTTASEGVTNGTECKATNGNLCVFPFKYGGKTYSVCDEYGNYFWCATSVKADGNYHNWGICPKDGSCPLEGQTTTELPTTTVLNTEPELMGWCESSDGQDQNSGVTNLAGGSKEDCYYQCKAVSQATGCEWYSSTNACSVHTLDVATGSGDNAFRCWVFKTSQKVLVMGPVPWTVLSVPNFSQISSNTSIQDPEVTKNDAYGSVSKVIDGTLYLCDPKTCKSHNGLEWKIEEGMNLLERKFLTADALIQSPQPMWIVHGEKIPTVDVWTPQSGKWIKDTNYKSPYPVDLGCIVVIEGKILQIGGSGRKLEDGSYYTKRVFLDDVEVASLKEKRIYHHCVIFENRVWVAGGVVRGEHSVNLHKDVEIYDYKTDTWSAGPSFPEEIADRVPKLKVIHGELYYIGSYCGKIFKLDNGVWKKVAENLPTNMKVIAEVVEISL